MLTWMSTGDVTLNDVQLIEISLNGLWNAGQLDQRRAYGLVGPAAAQENKTNQERRWDA